MILLKFATDALKMTAFVIVADVVAHRAIPAGKKAYRWLYSEYLTKIEDTNE